VHNAGAFIIAKGVDIVADKKEYGLTAAGTPRKRPPRKGEGRPLTYATPEDMQKVIDAYFKDCEGKPLIGDDGNPVLDKWGNAVILGAKPPTITGLALALGFNSRQALLNYQDRPEFNDAVTRAKSRVEAYTESRLFDKDGANGAKFSLANNFRGWAEKQEIDMTAGMTIKVELTDD
jgi:hypothetical protein